MAAMTLTLRARVSPLLHVRIGLTMALLQLVQLITPVSLAISIDEDGRPVKGIRVDVVGAQVTPEVAAAAAPRA